MGWGSRVVWWMHDQGARYAPLLLRAALQPAFGAVEAGVVAMVVVGLGSCAAMGLSCSRAWFGRRSSSGVNCMLPAAVPSVMIVVSVLKAELKTASPPRHGSPLRALIDCTGTGKGLLGIVSGERCEAYGTVLPGGA